MQMSELTRQTELDRLVTGWNAVAPEYDSFPTTLQHVGSRLVGSIENALTLGRYVGFCSITRQIKIANVQLKGDGIDEIFQGPETGRVGCFITRPLPIGTGELGDPNSNFLIVARDAQRPSDLWAVELGCYHDFTPGRNSNCYSESICTKCGWGYAVDSSD